MSDVDKKFFAVLVGIGLIILPIALRGTTIALWVSILIITIGFIGAYPVPKVKQIIGVPVLMIAIFAATAAYPSVMGEATFGQWWPTVSNSIDEAKEAVSPALQGFQGVQTNLGKGWTCLASPSQCYQMYQPETEVEKTYRALVVEDLKPLGIGKIDEPIDYEKKSEEPVFQTSFNIHNTLSIENYDNPPTVHDVEVESRPLFDAAQKETTLRGPEEIKIGSGGVLKGRKCEGGSKCDIGEFHPQEMGNYIMSYYPDNFTSNAAPGQYVKYGVDVKYDVSTHSVLDAEVVKSSRYDELAQKGELEFYEPSSTFEWGPISIGIAASRQQPLRGGDHIPVIVSVTNRGSGYLYEINDFNISSSLTEEGLSVECEDKLLGTSDDAVEFFNKKSSIADLLTMDCGGGLRGSLCEVGKEQVDEVGEYIGLKSENPIQAKCVVTVEDPEEVRKTHGITVDLDYTYRVSQTDNIEAMYECVPDELLNLPDKIEKEVKISEKYQCEDDTMTCNEEGICESESN